MNEFLAQIRTWLDGRASFRSPGYRLGATMSYRTYATTHEQYRCWPDVLIEAIPLPRACSVAVFGVLFFVAGAAIALPYGFFLDYAQTPAIYLGCAGFTLVFGAIHWGSLRFHQTYEHLRPVFAVDDQTYLRIIKKWLVWFTRSHTSALYSIALYIFVVFAVVRILTESGGPTVPDNSAEPRLLSAAWYLPANRTPMAVIILVLGALVSIALGTAMRILVLNLRFLADLRRLPVIPVPTLVRARLRRMIDLYVGTSLAWTAGVALFGTFFYRNYSLLSSIFIIALLAVGIATFGVPQLICRGFITDSYNGLCSLALHWLYHRLGTELEERDRAELRPAQFVAGHLTDLVQLTERPKTWVYDSQDVFLWSTSQVIAFLAVFAHEPVARLIG